MHHAQQETAHEHKNEHPRTDLQCHANTCLHHQHAYWQGSVSAHFHACQVQAQDSCALCGSRHTHSNLPVQTTCGRQGTRSQTSEAEAGSMLGCWHACVEEWSARRADTKHSGDLELVLAIGASAACICVSIYAPGRRSAGSSAFGRFVAPTTTRCPRRPVPPVLPVLPSVLPTILPDVLLLGRLAAPSISVSSCATTRDSSARPASRRGHSASTCGGGGGGWQYTRGAVRYGMVRCQCRRTVASVVAAQCSSVFTASMPVHQSATADPAHVADGWSGPPPAFIRSWTHTSSRQEGW